VAIRSVLIERAAGQAEYGVGGGIVWDSTSADEYEECLVKARVLTRRQPQFELLESLLWRPAAGAGDPGYFLLESHLKRLGDSAVYFQFRLDLKRAAKTLTATAAGLPPVPHKVRLTAARDGRYTCQAIPLDPLSSASPARLRLAQTPVDSASPFLYHKTTQRAVYEQALAGAADCDDVILWNERGELTETAIANLALQMDGRWITPPLSCGLLGGVMRGWLLEQGVLQEGVLRVTDLRRAEKMAVFNSVRGWRAAVWKS
jgi:para-aminobenzoate synthetase/4-amino-4-deoxychorismate lyase